MIAALLWAFLFMLGGQIIGEIVSKLTENIIGNHPAVILLNNLICGFLFTALLVFARIKYLERRKISSIGLRRNNFIRKYFIGFGIGLVMFSAVVLLLLVTGHLEVNRSQGSPVGLAALGSVFLVLPGWIIQSGTEEILSRGWLMNVLGARYRAAVGLTVSASLFGFVHLLNPNVNILAIMNIVLVGFFFGLYVIKTTDLWGACGLHAAWNWAQGNIYGFEVSGQKLDVGSLLHLKLTGAEWFTGGNFGPEAGIAATIILSASVIILYQMQPK